MTIQIITLFPSVFETILSTSMHAKALSMGAIEYEFINLRDFGLGKRGQVDDKAYGMGPGMVLMAEPLKQAIDFAKNRTTESSVILMSARGKLLKQHICLELSAHKNLIIICGHYEGVDERIMPFVDYELSVGEYVLTGGEIPAMLLADSIVRLLPGVLEDPASHQDESYGIDLLEYPQYTRPAQWQDASVPDVLRSGNHAKIHDWRVQQSIKKTKENRPDMIEL
jgi:tRNA (guanine37-N1)-methyltransferase